IPIYVAALTPKSLRQLGEVADGWLPTHWPRARLQDGIAEIARGAASVQRDVNSIAIAPFVNVIVSDDAAKARNQARLPLAYYVGGMGNYYRDALARLGFDAEVDQIRELWQAGRRKSAMAAVTDEMVDAVAVCGTLENCRARLDEMCGFGATVPLVPIPAEGSPSERCRAIEALIE
ncbi:MAG TPA: LLM class flavin-dependent oxidoreductase, partial [Blastocatellia bacterium]|nr:LLM class flavin-dependent oxidoreductase [Blastocatellia bacterium]